MAYVEAEDDTISCLEGTSGNEKGGLIIMKKGPSSDTDKHKFKMPTSVAPKASVLGLDKLAAMKRKQDSELIDTKKSKLFSYTDDKDDDNEDDTGEKKRKYDTSVKDRYI